MAWIRSKEGQERRMPSTVASERPTASGEAYWVLRSLSLQGNIVGRPLSAARAALDDLGLAELEQPSRHQDQQLLETCQASDHRGAFLSLRCRVSWPLEQKVRAMHRQFAKNYGLELLELAAFALDDTGQSLSFHSHVSNQGVRTSDPFTVEVIRSFDPARSSLGHWAKMRYEGRNDLKAFLNKRGIDLKRDWALLADTSYIQVRAAVAEFGTQVTPERAEQLLRSYLPLYKEAKLLHVQQTGRQRGWDPDTSFLHSVAPEQSSARTQNDLLDMARSIRLWQSRTWRCLEADQFDAVLPDSEPEDEGAYLRDSAVVALVERVGKAYLSEQLGAIRSDEARLNIWRVWSRGLSQRQIEEHCKSSQPAVSQSTVSRTLDVKARAQRLTTLVMEQLKHQASPRQDAIWNSLFRSIESQTDAERRLMNHLQKPEQEGSVSPMQRWVMEWLLAEGEA
jgi:hypothetical protein